MGSEDNANMVQRGHAAFSTGDMAALSELFAGDAVWHVPGSGSRSGAKHGRDAILAFFGALTARPGAQRQPLQIPDPGPVLFLRRLEYSLP